MNLYIDIGNTRAKSALDDNGKFKSVEVSTDLLKSGQVSQVVAAAVGSRDLLDSIFPTIQDLKLPFLELQTSEKACGVTNSYTSPKNLGVDRWLTLIAAHSLYPNRSVLIVDAGTALTVDILDPSGLHLGGWIVPGFDLMVDSIVSKAPKVFDANVEMHDVLLGKDTPDCVNFGCLAAQIGIVSMALSFLPKPRDNAVPVVLLTGGGVARIRPMLNSHIGGWDDYQTVEHNFLVFEGMKVYANKILS